MKSTMLLDESGNTSSKRIWGTVCLSAYVLSSIIMPWYSLFTDVGITVEAAGLIKTLGYVGGGLLGIGVAEKFGNKKVS